jgi:hypothetical protein
MKVQGSYINFQVALAETNIPPDDGEELIDLVTCVTQRIQIWCNQEVLKCIIFQESTGFYEGLCELSEAIARTAPLPISFQLHLGAECRLGIDQSRWPKVKLPFRRFLREFGEEHSFFYVYDKLNQRWVHRHISLGAEERLLRETNEEKRRAIILDSYDARTILR